MTEPMPAGETPAASGAKKPRSIFLLAGILGLLMGCLSGAAGSVLRFVIPVVAGNPYAEPFTIIPIPFVFWPVVPVCGSTLGLLGGLLAALILRRTWATSSRRFWLVIALLLAGLLFGLGASFLFTPFAL